MLRKHKFKKKKKYRLKAKTLLNRILAKVIRVHQRSQYEYCSTNSKKKTLLLRFSKLLYFRKHLTILIYKLPTNCGGGEYKNAPIKHHSRQKKKIFCCFSTMVSTQLGLTTKIAYKDKTLVK